MKNVPTSAIYIDYIIGVHLCFCFLKLGNVFNYVKKRFPYVIRSMEYLWNVYMEMGKNTPYLNHLHTAANTD